MFYPIIKKIDIDDNSKAYEKGAIKPLLGENSELNNKSTITDNSSSRKNSKSTKDSGSSEGSESSEKSESNRNEEKNEIENENENENNKNENNDENDVKDGISIITRLLLDFIDTRTDTIFDEFMINKISPVFLFFICVLYKCCIVALMMPIIMMKIIIE